MLEGDVEWRWMANSMLEGRWSGGQTKMDTYGLHAVICFVLLSCKCSPLYSICVIKSCITNLTDGM